MLVFKIHVRSLDRFCIKPTQQIPTARKHRFVFTVESVQILNNSISKPNLRLVSSVEHPQHQQLGTVHFLQLDVSSLHQYTTQLVTTVSESLNHLTLPVLFIEVLKSTLEQSAEL